MQSFLFAHNPLPKVNNEQQTTVDKRLPNFVLCKQEGSRRILVTLL